MVREGFAFDDISRSLAADEVKLVPLQHRRGQIIVERQLVLRLYLDSAKLPHAAICHRITNDVPHEGSRMPRIRVLVVVGFCLGYCSASLAIDVELQPVSATRPINDFDWSTFKVKIVDAAGAPIAGARVRFTALSANNGYGWWSDVIHGVPPIAISDRDGFASVQYPKSIHPIHKHEVKSARFLAIHPDYCWNGKHLDVSGDKDSAEIRLENGFKLRIAGVTKGSDQPLSHCHVLFEGSVDELPEFVRDESDWLNSATISRDRRWFRVVYAPPGRPVQFGRLQAWDPDEAQQREFRVEVRPGVRVFGILPNEIPRPISRGRVAVSCGSALRNDPDGQRPDARPVWWHDVAIVRQDGSFDFPSLPPGHVAQLFAYADDWVSAQPSEEAFQMLSAHYPKDTRKPSGWFRYGQVLRLVGSSQEVKLEMEQAGTVKVRCIDQNRQPLQGITVSFWPNHIVLGGGGGIFCEHKSTMDFIGGRAGHDVFNSNPFHAQSSRAGVAIVRSIPADKQHIYVGSDIWSSCETQWGLVRELDRAKDQVDVRAGETVELEFQLKPFN